MPPSPKSRKSRPNPEVATAAAAAEDEKQEDVTIGDTSGEAAEAANEVNAEAVEGSVSSDVVGVEALLLVVVPPLCKGGGGTVCEWEMADELT